MSFFDRFAAAVKDATMGSHFGMALDIAHAAQNPEAAGRLASALGEQRLQGIAAGAQMGAAQPMTPTGTLQGADAGVAHMTGGFGLFDALHFPLDYGVNRPLGTLAMTASDGMAGQRINDLDVWRRNWNRSDHTSAGQAISAYNMQKGYLQTGKQENVFGHRVIDSEQYAAAVKTGSQEQRDFFKTNPYGQFLSGGTDLYLNIVADPTLALGKGAKGARLARTAFQSNAERDAALDLYAGNINKAQATAQFGSKTAKRANRAADKMAEFDRRTDGMDFNSLMQQPEFRETSDAGALAYFYSRANEVGDETARMSLKRDVRAVAFGNRQAMTRLSEQRADLANELDRMTSPIDDTEALSRFSWDDHGQGMLDFSNRPANHAELDAKLDSIQDEMSRLERLDAVAGSTSTFTRTRAQNAVESQAQSNLRESVLTDGLGSMPVRVVKGTLGRAAPGHVSSVDAQQGFDQLSTLLARAPISGEQKGKWLQEFGQSATREQRVLAAQKIEAGMFRALGAEYGKTPREVHALMTAATTRRDMYRSGLRSALYSAAPEDQLIRFVDEEGLAHVFERPFLQSQLDDAVPMSDPAMIRKALEDDKRTGWVADWAERGQHTKDIADSIATTATRAWKDTALMRLAYPLRIQVDSQLRLMSAIGAMDYMTTVGRGTRNLLTDRVPFLREGEQYAAEVGTRGRKRLKSTGLMRQEQYRGVDVTPARNADEAAQVTRSLESDNSRILVMGNESTNRLGSMRASGKWGKVSGGDVNWSQAYMRAVNRQFRSSPIATRAMLDGSDDSVKAFIRTNPAARGEWNNFAKSWDHDLDAYVGSVRANVNHLLPTDDLRLIAAERNLTEADVEKAFRSPEARPPVHGESFTQVAGGAAGAWYQGVRERWYKFASDAPESVMARHPLYNSRFRHHMKQIIDRHGDDLTTNDVNRARRLADRQARKDMSETLYDMTSQRNIAHGMRFISPFFSAWEDTMRKWAMMFYDDPSRAVWFGKAWTAPDKAGIVEKDDQGNGYIQVPRLLTPLLPEGAANWRVRKDSFNIVWQGAPWWLPGFGPMVSVPTNEVVKKAYSSEANNPILKYVLPFGVSDDDPGTQLLPGWAKRAKGYFQDSDAFAQTYATLMAQEQIKWRSGERKSRPTEKEITNSSKNWALLRALTSFASPVTAEPTPEFQGYIDIAHRYRDDQLNIQGRYSEWVKAGSQGEPPPKDWQEKFYQDFPDYFDMSVSLSVNNTGITASDQAYRASRKNRELIAQNPQYGWAVVGPDNVGEFDQGVYAYQKSQSVGYGNNTKFRDSKDPATAVKDVQLQRGWMDYQKLSTAVDLELEARGLHSTQQRGAEDLQMFKEQGVAALTQENQTWGDAFTARNEGSSTQEFLRYMVGASKSSTLKDRPDIVAFGQYMDARRQVQQIMEQRGVKSIDAAAMRDVKSALDGYGTFLARNNLAFGQMWQRELENDNMRGDF